MKSIKKTVFKINVAKNIILPLAVFASFCGAIVVHRKVTENTPPRDTPTFSTENIPSSEMDFLPVYSLPNQQTIKERLSKIYADEKEMFLIRFADYGNEFHRMPCPQNQPIKVNVCFDANALAHVAFDDTIEELNELFKVVNPNYVFEIEYSPTAADTKNRYNVDIHLDPNMNKNVFGTTHLYLGQDKYEEIDGFEFFDTHMDINESLFKEDIVRLKRVFIHEMCHTLGLNDAYSNPIATEKTIMQYDNKMSYYSSLLEIDAATIAALYYDGTTEPEVLADYVADYQLKGNHTSGSLLEERYGELISNNWKHFLDDLDCEKIKQQITQIPNFKYYDSKLVEELFKAIDERKFVTSFGSEIFQAGEIFDTKSNPERTNTMHYLSNQWSKGEIRDLFSPALGVIEAGIYSYESTGTGQLTTTGFFKGVMYIKIGDFVLSGSYNENYDDVEFNPDGIYKITNLNPTEYFAQFGIDCLPLKNINESKIEKERMP